MVCPGRLPADGPILLEEGSCEGQGRGRGAARLGAHLHHEHNGIECDHGHDGVLERRRHHELPHAVLEALLVLGHVSGQRFGADGEVDAGPLRETGQWCEGQRRTAPDSEHPPSSSAHLFAFLLLLSPARIHGLSSPGWSSPNSYGSLRSHCLPELALTCLPLSHGIPLANMGSGYYQRPHFADEKKRLREVKPLL